ncbi:MAG TPA: hypothetical protein PLL10_10000, partial [Elusimicrobiales bacterium]|nr:hypothetical protein [Elusimicrobiales bacterium]
MTRAVFLLPFLLASPDAHAAAQARHKKGPPPKKACRVELKEMKGETPPYKYDIQYPQFASPCRSLNPRFRAFAADTLEDFRKNYGEI